MNYKIAICDDNGTDARYLSECVSRWARRGNLGTDIELFGSAESFLFRYEEDKTFDILLLDIEMGGMDGVALAKRIRGENQAVQIVFITGYPDFMAEGYEVSALHYLMKPILEEQLFGVLDRAVENLGKREKYVLLEAEGQKLRVSVAEVMCVEVFSHVCAITTQSREIKVKYSISELEELFGEELIRCHRSYLVNPRYLKSISKKDVVLDNDMRIPVSRSGYQAVNQGFIRYYKGEA